MSSLIHTTNWYKNKKIKKNVKVNKSNSIIQILWMLEHLNDMFTICQYDWMGTKIRIKESYARLRVLLLRRRRCRTLEITPLQSKIQIFKINTIYFWNVCVTKKIGSYRYNFDKVMKYNIFHCLVWFYSQ